MKVISYANNDTVAGVGFVFPGGTLTGPLYLSGNPAHPLHAVSKQYVDTIVSSLNAANITSGTLDAARLPAFTGDVIKPVGSSIVTLTDTGVTPGTYTKVIVDIKGRVIGGGSLTSSDITGVDWSKITTGKPTTLSGYGITDALSKSGGTLTGFLTYNGTITDNLQAVTKDYVDSLISGSVGLVTGDIVYKPVNTTPPGFLKCDGSAVSVVTYSALYSVIGDNYNNITISGQTDVGYGKPWKQQYEINNTQSANLTGWNFEPASLPEPIKRAQVVVTRNRVYLIGGYNGTNTVSTVRLATINSDGTLSSWMTQSSLPIPLEGAQAVVTINKVYLLGGYDGTNYVSNVYMATINSDGSLGTWMAEANLPSPVGFGKAVVIKNKLYYIGGENSTGKQSTIYMANVNPDGSIGGWSTVQPLPVALSRAEAVVLDYKLYIIGGEGATGGSDKIYSAFFAPDGTLDIWTSEFLRLYKDVSNYQVYVTNSKVYILGGYSQATGHSADIMTLDINTDRTLSNIKHYTSVLPTTISNSQVFAANGKLYVLGGHSTGGFAINNTLDKILTVNISGGLNDYSEYYDGIGIIETSLGSFRVPDLVATDPPGSYSYIKY